MHIFPFLKALNLLIQSKIMCAVDKIERPSFFDFSWDWSIYPHNIIPVNWNHEQLGIMDQKWGNGYKNDVWSMQGTDWYVRADIRTRNKHRQKLPRTTSQLKWKQLTPGLLPRPGQTYDDYLICEAAFANMVSMWYVLHCTVLQYVALSALFNLLTHIYLTYVTFPIQISYFI